MKLRVQSMKFQGPVYQDLIRPLQEDRMHEVPRQILLEGPTGTGKTLGLMAFVKAYMRKYPGVNCVVLRRVKADLAGSLMQSWEEEILDPSDPWDMWMLDRGTGRIPGHRSRDFYAYPNGSKLWCRGVDQWARVKSMSYALVWMLEGTEFEEQQLEGLSTRIRKRASDPPDLPWRGLICDTNPDAPQHWLHQRALRGDLHRIKTTLKDNAGFWNRAEQKWYPEGEEYNAELRARLKGHNFARYVNGEWVAAEGQILDWDESRQMFEGKVVREAGRRDRIMFPRTHPVLGDFVELVGYGASYDWGIRHAGTLQVWGLDAEGRQYLVEEVYMSERPVHWWAEWVIQFWKKYDLRFIVCDNAAVDAIQHFNVELQKQGGHKARIAIPCDKRSGQREKTNVEVLTEAFADHLDGKPWVYINRNALAHAPDSNLAVQRFAEEIPGYVYAPYDPGRHKGRPTDAPDPSCPDDGLDACTYFRVYLLGGRGVPERIMPADEKINPMEALKREYWRKRNAS